MILGSHTVVRTDHQSLTQLLKNGHPVGNACELWMLEFGALWMRACGT